jgi:hypothetical protein
MLGIAACLVLGAAAVAAPPDAEVMAPIQKFIDGFNAGDAEGAAATHAHTADLTILDEVPPFMWRGEQAFGAWAAALESDSQERGATEQVVRLGAPTRIESSGERAYVVVPAVYTFKEGGKPMREDAQMTFALERGGSGWLIHGWTWTGPKPVPAGPAKP